MKLVNIKNIERGLPRVPPLSDCIRFAGYSCRRCQHQFPLDLRVFASRRYQLARALGLAYLACPACGAHECEPQNVFTQLESDPQA